MEKLVKLQNEVEKLGDELNIPLTISLGVASYNHGDDWTIKKKIADDALYHVKNNTSDKNNIAYFNTESNNFELYKKNHVKKL